MPEWFIKRINDLAKSSINMDRTGKVRYHDRGDILTELRRYEQGLYQNDNNKEFFGLDDGYFTGEYKLKKK